MNSDPETKPFDHPLPSSGGSWVNDNGVLKRADDETLPPTAPADQPKSGKAKTKDIAS
jgi:hypothetical protein